MGKLNHILTTRSKAEARGAAKGLRKDPFGKGTGRRSVTVKSRKVGGKTYYDVLGGNRTKKGTKLNKRAGRKYTKGKAAASKKKRTAKRKATKSKRKR